MNTKKNKLENFNEITISYDSLNLKIKKIITIRNQNKILLEEKFKNYKDKILCKDILSQKKEFLMINNGVIFYKKN